MADRTRVYGVTPRSPGIPTSDGCGASRTGSPRTRPAFADTDPIAPDLNAVAVDRLRPPFDEVTECARALLFYREMANGVFTGRIA